jgi:predicted acyl esterase
MHGLEHWTHFYTDYGIAIQKKFFAHFLKGEANGWDQEPPVRLQVRHVNGFQERKSTDWPLPNTQWQKLHLHPVGQELKNEACTQAGSVSFDAQGNGLTFVSAPLAHETEITGPLAATQDADVFLVLRIFTADMREVTFAGAIDPHTPVAQGWLRASHRELDSQLSRPYRPYHTHRKVQPLQPGQPVALDIELWPTSIVVPAGYRIALSVRGKDYIYADKTGLKLSNFKNELRGCGPFLHDDPRDRPSDIFGGTTLVRSMKPICYCR